MIRIVSSYPLNLFGSKYVRRRNFTDMTWRQRFTPHFLRALVTELLTDLAYEEACTLGLSALDALHVAAAALSHCEEIVTTEKPFKPIHRFKAARVASLLSSDG
jgi:predicted nucleic acid-binding protein